MKIAWYALVVLVFSVSASAGDKSLRGLFEKQMTEGGYVGYEIIHVQENETDGWVLYTAWDKDYPDNRNRPNGGYFQKNGKRWQSAMGTACNRNSVSMFGLMGNGYLYCSVLRPDMDFESITAGDNEAQIFTFNESFTVWVAISPKGNATVVGTTADGREVNLN